MAGAPLYQIIWIQISLWLLSIKNIFSIFLPILNSSYSENCTQLEKDIKEGQTHFKRKSLIQAIGQAQIAFVKALTGEYIKGEDHEKIDENKCRSEGSSADFDIMGNNDATDEYLQECQNEMVSKSDPVMAELGLGIESSHEKTK